MWSMLPPSLRYGPARVPGARSRTLALVALVAAVAGCADPADRAAKARIFSPEEPAEDLQRAKEPLAVRDAATDPAVFRRLLTMSRLEATRRLGAHRATTTVQFRWTRAGRTVALTEKDELVTDASGQFRAVTTNDQDAGLEVVWVDGRAYAKSRYGPFRARRMDRAQQDAWRDRATPALGTIDGLFQRRLHLSPLGPADKGGRPALKFALLLGEPWGPDGSPRGLPPMSFGHFRVPGEDKARAGPDPDTARRLDFERRRVPEKVSGELLVDEATGVVLAATVKARFNVPGLPQEPAAALDLEVAFDVVPDASARVAAPADVTQARLAHAVNNPLWFLGDGAAPARAEEDEPAGADPVADPGTDDDADVTTPATTPVKKPAGR